MTALGASVPTRLCACGCGVPTKLAGYTKTSQGWIKGEPVAYLYAHRAPTPTPVADLVWPRIDVRGPDECWPWMGYVTPRGYGRAAGKYVHRLVLAEKLGRELTPDEVTRHTCDNTTCCNPNHLIPGTPADNVHDARDRGRLRRGESNPASKLTQSRADEIRALCATGKFGRRELAERFGVSIPTIYMVITRKAWIAC